MAAPKPPKERINVSSVKTKEEITIIRKAGRRLARILATVGDAIRPGTTPRDLDVLAERLIRAGGDEPSFLHYWPDGASRPYPATICVSVNDDVVHGIPGTRPFQEGDIVGIDLGLKHEGFHADSAKTVPVGTIDPTARELIETTREALLAGIAAARGGNRVGDVGHAVLGVIQKKKFSLVEELGGHGIGRRVHEEPHIPNIGKPGAGARLLPGMTIAIEPIVNEGSRRVYLADDGYTYKTKDGKRSAHFEHTILITEGEPEILTLS